MTRTAATDAKTWVAGAAVITFGVVVGMRVLLASGDTALDLAALHSAVSPEAMVTSRSFWLAILAAPFALFLVLSFKSGITGGVEHYAFAFQNGFFVKTLIPSPKPE